MAISASSVASSSTLETLRTQFNNLVTDVAGIEGGTISYTTLNATNLNSTTVNVKEDGTIIFEGATDDGFETTLTVVDPTADRTVTFPNETGTVHTSGGTTTHTAIVVADGGNIGSASDTDAITIAANGNITVNQNLSIGGNLDVTGTLDLSDSNFTNVGSIQLDSIAGDGDTNTSITFSGSDVITIATGGSTAATFNASQVTTLSGNLIIPDAGNIGSASDTDAIAIGSDGDVTLTQDLELQHDGAILSFGTNDEIALTHVHDTGLLLTDSGGSPTLQFHDSAESVSSDGSKLILTSNSVAFSLPTADGSNGQALATNGSGVLSFVDVSSAADDLTAGDSAVTLTTTSGNITVDAQGNDTDIIFKGTDGSSDTTFLTIDGSDAGTLIANHDLELGTDGSIIKFGADNEITLTHVADTGLLLEDSGGSPTIQLHDSNESVSSDGTNLILTSGGTAFKLPTSDGSSGQALGTNGSGTLSFVNVASAADDLTAGDAAVTLTTTSGNITIDAQANDSDIIFKGTDGSSDTTFLTIDGSAAGEATFNAGIVIADAGTIGSASDKDAIAIGSDGDVTLTQDLELQHDGAILSFGTNDEITLTHVHDTGLLLADSGGSPTLQFHDANESVSSDGSKLILTSNGVAFSLPTADGSNTQVLQTNGSGVLSFADAGANTAFNAFEYTATAGQTSFSGSDDNSASLSYTAGVNSVQVYVNGILLDSSDYTATNGTAVVLSTGAHLNDMIKINAVQATNLVSADLDGAEFVLDADGDTSLRANTDDQIDVKIGNAIDFAFKANTFEVQTGSNIDMNGTELILDADGDTSITADTDDQIDVRIAGADDFQFTANTLNVLSGSTLDVNSGATLTLNGTAGTGIVGKQTMWIPAAAMYPNSTNGCADLAQVELSNGPELKCLDFDNSSDENAQFTVAFPKSWNEGTVTFQAFFTVTGTNTGTVAWGLSATALADNDSMNTAFGTNVVATAKAHSGTSNDLNVSNESGNVTIAGSPSTDELVVFQIMRDVSADNQSGDARLLGIKLFFTNDALTDA